MTDFNGGPEVSELQSLVFHDEILCGHGQNVRCKGLCFVSTLHLKCAFDFSTYRVKQVWLFPVFHVEE